MLVTKRSSERNKVFRERKKTKKFMQRGSNWVFRNNKDEHGIVTKNKERLVVQGYSQEEGINYDETFAPVDDKGISICQEQYTRNLLKKYEISDSSSVKTLMVPPNNLGLDLAGFDLKGYLDSDYAGCNIDRKSTSAEVEDVAATGCCTNIFWMKIQLSDYDIYYKMVPIFCGNTSAIAISNNPVFYSRTKHIDIRYHFIRGHILKGDIELHFIPTKYQLADIFTKPLDEPTFT
nr:retrovirus-related Pol polyprotein from transposon TNT 1-94 [Tanacetum cinerariifolium]